MRLHWLKGKGYRSGKGPPLRESIGPCPIFNHIMVFALHVTDGTESLVRHRAVVIYAKGWRFSCWGGRGLVIF